MSAHTPGPWNVSRRDPARFQVATVELFGIYSRHPESGNDETGTPEADARLIAAAPELLEACRVAFDQTCSVGRPKDWEQLRAAIAKAAGSQP